jgi:oligosaccharyltransferase complex subunit alpha (ribophorin I)
MERRDVEYATPFAPKNVTQHTHITYLDSVGRPALTFGYEDLTDRQAGTIYVRPRLASLRRC